MSLLEFIPQPKDFNALRRKIKAFDNNAETSRTFESSSLTEGTFRISHGGNMVISSGGTLELVDGNLILGEGIIEGKALQDQIEAVPINISKNTGYTGSTSETTLYSHKMTAPSWANAAIVQTTIIFNTRSAQYDGDIQMSLLINGENQISAWSMFGYSADDKSSAFSTTIPFATKVNITDRALNLDIKIKCRANNVLQSAHSHLSFTGVVIWLR